MECLEAEICIEMLCAELKPRYELQCIEAEIWIEL